MNDNEDVQRSLGWALIGCGGAGRVHLTGASATEDIEIRGFCDVRKESAKRFSGQHDGTYHTNDPEQIFNDPEVDIVSIATSHNSHAELAIKALNAGKHVWLEKPMAMTTVDCLRINEALKSAGTKMMLNFSIRFSGAARTVKERMRPLVSHGQCMMAPADLTTWRWHPEEGGGLMYDVGVHAIDLLCWIHDSEPVEVSAVGGQITHPRELANTNVIDTAAATIKFANSSVATFLMSDAGSSDIVSKWFFEFFDGKRAAILDNHFRRVTFSDGDSVSTPSDTATSVGFDNVSRTPPPIERLPVLVEAIRTGIEPYVSSIDGLRATHVVEKISESIHTGKPQKIDSIEHLLAND